MSITEGLTKIRMSPLKEARNKFGHSNVSTADGKILYKDEGDTKAKVYFDWYSDKQKLYYGKRGIFFDFDDIILFLTVWGTFCETFQNCKLLCLFNTFYRRSHYL